MRFGGTSGSYSFFSYDGENAFDFIDIFVPFFI